MSHVDCRTDDPPANVLLVDDRLDHLRELHTILDDLGQNLVEARAAEEALALLAQEDFAAVLMDVQTQGLNGFEAARRIRRRERSQATPIMFLTAHESAAFPLVEAYRLGAVDYLVRPLIPEIVRAKVAAFVELFRKTERIRRQAERLREYERRERQRAEAALRESEERQRLWIKCVRDYAVFLMDVEGRITSWNEGAERLTGYPTADILGQPFALLFTPEDRALGKPARELQSAAATGSASDQNWIVRCDGSRFWADGFTTALHDEDGRHRGFGKICRDLTERQQYEEALRQRAEALAEADRRKDEFLAMLAHELRNPLAPIRNAAHALQVRGADPTTLEWARGVLERQVRHMAHLVDDLLDATRIRRGKIVLQRERLDLTEVVRATAEDHRPGLAAAGVLLKVELPGDPVWLIGDPTRLAQVLSNLLHNATKFTEPGGVVTVRLTVDRPRQRAWIGVHDTGMGIGPEFLAQVFEPFTQADRSLDRSRGGLGLGLAVVKGLIELHGGEVTAQSEGLGRGSTFTLWLPLAELSADRPKAPDVPIPTGRCRRVLVADDNRDSADSLRLLLEALGHEVAVAYSGPSALAVAEDFGPDVVVCDLGLPELDGFGVARALRAAAATCTARLIALSGYATEADRWRSAEAGFEAHLIKPVEPATLQSAVEQERTANHQRRTADEPSDPCRR